MIDIEDRLESSSQSIRTQVNTMTVRPPSSVVERHRVTQVASLFSVVAVVALLIFSSLNLFNAGSDVAATVEAEVEPAYSYGLDLPGWTLLGAWESEDRTGRSQTWADQMGITSTPRRIGIDTGTAALERLETLGTLGIIPTSTITVDGRDASVYITGAGAVVAWSEMVISTKSATDDAVVFLFEGIPLDEAQTLLASIRPLDKTDWDEIASRYEPPVTTTIDEADNNN